MGDSILRRDNDPEYEQKRDQKKRKGINTIYNEVQEQQETTLKLTEELEKLKEKELQNLKERVKYPLQNITFMALKQMPEFKRAQHIKFKTDFWKHWNHAIVESIDDDNRDTFRVNIIMWTSQSTREIVKITLKPEFGSGLKIMVADYPDGCYEDEVVVKRATARMGETDYHRTRNHAHGFPEWCKTGRGSGSYDNTEADNSYHLAQLEYSSGSIENPMATTHEDNKTECYVPLD